MSIDWHEIVGEENYEPAVNATLKEKPRWSSVWE